jgi:hypothetical protein
MTMFIRGEITVVFIEVWRNKKGPCSQNGKPISPNRRCNIVLDIIDEIKFKGGKSFVDIANKFEVSNGCKISNSCKI